MKACQLELRGVSVVFGSFAAASDVSLSLEKGEIGCLLGPSGCGKTTVLRAIAGFEPISAGEIILHGQVIGSTVTRLPPERRKVGMVFQDFALFPHLSVWRNVGFGLNSLGRQERDQRIDEMLQLVGLEGQAERFPHELSGGQQQRVALARALAPQPDLLLLDEPFSSLDSELREQLAAEVRELLKARGVTAILVTHDQHEAFAMADRVNVMRGGRVVQSDTPYNLYHHPSSEFVAGFIGQGSLISLVVGENETLDKALGLADRARPPLATGGKCSLLVRPGDARYGEGSELQLPVARRVLRGGEYLYELDLPDGQRIPCLAPSHVEIAVGECLPVRFEFRNLVLFREMPAPSTSQHG